MGKIKLHLPVKTFCAITFAPEIDCNLVVEQIEAIFGAIDLRSEVFNFDGFTSYYQAEMGAGLQKLFVSFGQLAEAESLPHYKVKTNELETRFIRDRQRSVNVDPGYLTEAKVVLATTKDYSHRLYLGQGIFGDIHLQFARKSFQPQAWTYPDYQQELAVQFFNRLREIYRRQLGLL